MASLCRTKKGSFMSSKTAKRLKNLPVPNTRYSSTSNEGSSATVSRPQQELHSKGNSGSVNAPEDCFVMEGPRVVEISHLASQLQCLSCGTDIHLRNVVKEARCGLGSVLQNVSHFISGNISWNYLRKYFFICIDLHSKSLLVHLWIKLTKKVILWSHMPSLIFMGPVIIKVCGTLGHISTPITQRFANKRLLFFCTEMTKWQGTSMIVTVMVTINWDGLTLIPAWISN